ncbi:MAG TPA: FkbM family methyltransferase [Acetobacteraceae bacterium]
MPSVQTRYGELVVPDTEQDVVGRFLKSHGEWGEAETSFIGTNLADGARVLDVGAFVGTFGLSLSQKRRLDFICFVEPNPSVIPLLEQNVQRNCMVRAAVVDRLVAPAFFEPKKATMVQGNLGSVSFAAHAGASRQEVLFEVPKPVRLATLREEFGPFDLIKLDAEGMELDILSDDAPALAQTDVTIWVECNETVTALEMAGLLVSLGRPVYYVTCPVYLPDNFRHSTDPIFPFACEAGLFVHSGAPPILARRLQDAGARVVPIDGQESLREALWRTPRWAPAEWWGPSMHEVIALAIRKSCGQDYASFLSQVPAPQNETIPELRAALAELQEIADSRLLGLRAAHERLARLRQKLELQAFQRQEAAADQASIEKAAGEPTTNPFLD